MKFIYKNGYFEIGKKTYIMGILNVTPDSFYDGGRYNTPEKALEHAEKMVKDGADIIDIGANSTRPGANVLSAEKELEIIKRYIPFLTERLDTVFSVDTFYPEVAEFALQNGVSIINDVSGVFNEEMAKTVKKHNCGWVIMHTGGGDANKKVEYSSSVTKNVNEFFDDMLKKCNEFGISSEHIMLDPGIGFGKNFDDDIELIKNVSKIKNKNSAFLMALSNKRVIKNSSGAEGEERLFGTISANVLSVMGGADFLRVHEVLENRLAVNTADKIIRG